MYAFKLLVRPQRLGAQRSKEVLRLRNLNYAI